MGSVRSRRRPAGLGQARHHVAGVLRRRRRCFVGRRLFVRRGRRPRTQPLPKPRPQPVRLRRYRRWAPVHPLWPRQRQAAAQVPVLPPAGADSSGGSAAASAASASTGAPSSVGASWAGSAGGGGGGVSWRWWWRRGFLGRLGLRLGLGWRGLGRRWKGLEVDALRKKPGPPDRRPGSRRSPCLRSAMNQ